MSCILLLQHHISPISQHAVCLIANRHSCKFLWKFLSRTSDLPKPKPYLHVDWVTKPAETSPQSDSSSRPLSRRRGLYMSGATAYAGTRERNDSASQETSRQGRLQNKTFPSPPELRVCFGIQVLQNIILVQFLARRTLPRRGDRVEKPPKKNTEKQNFHRGGSFQLLPAFLFFSLKFSESLQQFVPHVEVAHFEQCQHLGWMGNRGKPFRTWMVSSSPFATLEGAHPVGEASPKHRADALWIWRFDVSHVISYEVDSTVNTLGIPSLLQSIPQLSYKFENIDPSDLFR